MTPPSVSPMLHAARAAYSAGLSVVPPREDGTKAPVAEWKRFQSTRPDAAQMKAWYGPCTGLGAITGRVSGNIEAFDFDDHPTYDAFVELAGQAGLGDLVRSIEAGYCEDTPKGGVHWLYRCEDVSGNLKLAKRQVGAEVKTLIETRGEGGYIVLAPSNGKVHDTGKPYVLRLGGFGSIVRLVPEHRLELLSLARSFDEMPSKEKPTNVRAGSAIVSDKAGLRAGDDFRTRATWSEVLEPAGWVQVFTRGDVTHWRRPGKSRGTSATTNIHGSDLLYVFSGSTPFEAERGYNKFAAYTILNHDGDFSAATSELITRGFGAPTAPVADTPTADVETAPAKAVLCEPLNEVIGRVLEDLQNDAPPKVCATPYPSLNYYLNGGFSPGELIYLGARPAIGKSSIGLDIARKASRSGPVLVVSREMVNVALALRMMAQEGRIHAAHMKRKTLSVSESTSIMETATRLGGRPIWLSRQGDVGRADRDHVRASSGGSLDTGHHRLSATGARTEGYQGTPPRARTCEPGVEATRHPVRHPSALSLVALPSSPGQPGALARQPT
jgi:hypothetical protein